MNRRTAPSPASVPMLALALVLVLGACGGGARSSAGSIGAGAASPSIAATAQPTGQPQATARATAGPTTTPTPAATAGAPTSAPATSAPATTVTPSPAPTAAPSAAVSITRATWTKLRPASGPSPREDHTWTLDESGERAYLFGGRAGGTLHDDLWVYDLATDTWSELSVSNGPDARFGHEAVWLPGRGLVIFAGQAGPRFFNDLWLFDPASATWAQLPSSGDAPVPRYGSCAAIGPDGRLWISHGFTEDGARFSDTRAYDFATRAWTDETPEGRRPVERCLHGCWFDDAGDFVLYAGQTTGVTALGDLWHLAAAGTVGAAWRQVEGDLPAARNLYAHAGTGAARIVFGGRGNDGYRADLWAFWPASAGELPRSLEVTGDAPPPRSGAELIEDAARGRLLLFGGKHDGGTFQDLWQLVLE